jgi:murein L,D-transpeptidase YafK
MVMGHDMPHGFIAHEAHTENQKRGKQVGLGGLKNWSWAVALIAPVLLFACATPRPAAPPATVTAPSEKADRVIIAKAEHKLYLMRGDRALYIFAIALGAHPRGPKHQEGDGRTPEGSYTLDWRNPNSQFYRSVHISYPNDSDLAWAQAHHVSPGGDIMIHGLPAFANVGARHVKTDWTDGCIAVTNEEMDIIWRLVDDNTPVLILAEWSDTYASASF